MDSTENTCRLVPRFSSKTSYTTGDVAIQVIREGKNGRGNSFTQQWRQELQGKVTKGQSHSNYTSHPIAGEALKSSIVRSVSC